MTSYNLININNNSQQHTLELSSYVTIIKVLYNIILDWL